jgi:hypothetical protein
MVLKITLPILFWSISSGAVHCQDQPPAASPALPDLIEQAQTRKEAVINFNASLAEESRTHRDWMDLFNLEVRNMNNWQNEGDKQIEGQTIIFHQALDGIIQTSGDASQSKQDLAQAFQQLDAVQRQIQRAANLDSYSSVYLPRIPGWAERYAGNYICSADDQGTHQDVDCSGGFSLHVSQAGDQMLLSASGKVTVSQEYGSRTVNSVGDIDGVWINRKERKVYLIGKFETTATSPTRGEDTTSYFIVQLTGPPEVDERLTLVDYSSTGETSGRHQFFMVGCHKTKSDFPE